MPKILLAVLAIVFLPACEQAPEETSRVLAIRCGSLVDGLANEVLDGRTVIVENERIAALLRLNEPVPEGAELFDLSDYTCMPGLIDTHTHIALNHDDSSDLNALYRKAAAQLSLAPSDHEAEPIKRVLGSLQTLVNGLATLRNRLSDAHGRGEKIPARPSPRHARLAVNSAGAAAAFLCETCLHGEGAAKRP